MNCNSRYENLESLLRELDYASDCIILLSKEHLDNNVIQLTIHSNPQQYDSVEEVLQSTREIEVDGEVFTIRWSFDEYGPNPLNRLYLLDNVSNKSDYISPQAGVKIFSSYQDSQSRSVVTNKSDSEEYTKLGYIYHRLKGQKPEEMTVYDRRDTRGTVSITDLGSCNLQVRYNYPQFHIQGEDIDCEQIDKKLDSVDEAANFVDDLIKPVA
jgi:hypothetical protein